MADLYGPDTEGGYGQKIVTALGNIFISFFVPIAAFGVLWAGFVFLRSGRASQLVTTLVAIIWGVGGVAALYYISNFIIQRLSLKWRKRFTPFLFVGPALIILGYYLLLPAIRSLYMSFFGRVTKEFVGLANYTYIFTDRTMRIALVNNLLWMIFGTSLSIIFGLLISFLAERSKFEKLAKTLIFLPMAISFVGAGVIWKFIYAYKPVGEAQIGLLNAIVTYFGGHPVNWIVLRQWNTLLLVIIFVWLQTGYAMVILSAAIKGVPETLKEAARIDGAGEIRIIFQIIIPAIKGSIITVGTTILILTLKVFDIVYAMTNGLFGTEVLASQQYKQMFKFLNYGRGSSIAIVILIAVIPVMWYNLKQFGKREVF